MQQLTPKVCVETGYRGAVVGYIATGEGAVMIDTPWRPTDALDWRNRIEAKLPVKYLINTHWHRDHILCNIFYDAPVIAHEQTRKALLATDNKYLLTRIQEIDPDGFPLLANYRVKVPAITFSETMTLHLRNTTIQLVHLPGHSPDQIGVYVPGEKVLFAGDNVVCRVQAFFFDSDPFAWLRSLERMAEMEIDHIVPGHGEICDKSYLQEQSAFIQEWLDAVKQARDKGWTREEAMSRISFLDRYPMLSKGSEQMGPALQKENVARIWDVLSQR